MKEGFFNSSHNTMRCVKFVKSVKSDLGLISRKIYKNGEFIYYFLVPEFEESFMVMKTKGNLVFPNALIFTISNFIDIDPASFRFCKILSV